MIGVTIASRTAWRCWSCHRRRPGRPRSAMTMAADATNGAGPAAILTAVGIASEDHART
jgi:hypothetical protein